MGSEVKVAVVPSFRWWFRPAETLIYLAFRIKPARWQGDLLTAVVKHGIKHKVTAQ